MAIFVPSGLLLVVEAATAAGSLALLERGEDQRLSVRASCAVPMGSGRADVLTPALSQLLRDGGCALSDLAALVCGAGPGSFTSLRIAASFAKGLAYGLNVPLYAVPSLLLAVGDANDVPAPGEYRVALDALRGELYVQRVRVDEHGSILPVGPLERNATSTYESDSLRAVDLSTDVVPRATTARLIADWHSYGPVSLDAWEPSYGRLAEAQVKWEASHGRALVVD